MAAAARGAEGGSRGGDRALIGRCAGARPRDGGGGYVKRRRAAARQSVSAEETKGGQSAGGPQGVRATGSGPRGQRQGHRRSGPRGQRQGHRGSGPRGQGHRGYPQEAQHYRDIARYFTKKVWAELGVWEKTPYKHLKPNYDTIDCDRFIR
eukprot:gi/632986215/ref/XP_007910111.1/ PREDICTED: rRNA 2'-O-methyltransferase fibrillarin-like [Callorhinchus milii]